MVLFSLTDSVWPSIPLNGAGATGTVGTPEDAQYLVTIRSLSSVLKARKTKQTSTVHLGKCIIVCILLYYLQ